MAYLQVFTVVSLVPFLKFELVGEKSCLSVKFLNFFVGSAL